MGGLVGAGVLLACLWGLLVWRGFLKLGGSMVGICSCYGRWSDSFGVEYCMMFGPFSRPNPSLSNLKVEVDKADFDRALFPCRNGGHCCRRASTSLLELR